MPSSNTTLKAQGSRFQTFGETENADAVSESRSQHPRWQPGSAGYRQHHELTAKIELYVSMRSDGGSATVRRYSGLRLCTVMRCA